MMEFLNKKLIKTLKNDVVLVTTLLNPIQGRHLSGLLFFTGHHWKFELPVNQDEAL